MSVPGPIKFDNVEYNLTWSSHPSSNYFKQEYIAKSDSVQKFRKMLMLDFVEGSFKAKDVIALKISELDKLKKSNPAISYEVIENKGTGEYMLDFLLSENTPDGRYLNIVERNVYRYKKIKDKNGHVGVLLFGVSVRSYGDDIIGFLTALKINRDDLINAVGQFDIPEITISK